MEGVASCIPRKISTLSNKGIMRRTTGISEVVYCVECDGDYGRVFRDKYDAMNWANIAAGCSKKKKYLVKTWLVCEVRDDKVRAE